MQGIFEAIREDGAVRQICQCIAGGRPVLVSGVGDGAQNHLSAALAVLTERPLVVITANELKAQAVWEDMKFYTNGQACLFPAKDPLFYSADVRGLAVEERRMQVLRRIRENNAPCIVMSIEALYDRLIPREKWEKSILRRRIGEAMPVDDLARTLVRMGYERQDQVDSPGQFSIRGGIVDIYGITEEAAWRIEMWGDEIDSIRVLDVETQRSVRRLDSITVYPAAEIVVDEEAQEQGCARIREQMKAGAAAFRKEGQEEEAERLEELTAALLERLSAGRFRGLESYVPLFFPDSVTIADYFPASSLICLQDPARVREKASVLERELDNSIENRLRKGYLLSGQGSMYPGWEEVVRSLDPFARVFLCSLPGSSQNVFPIKELISLSSRSISTGRGDERLLLDELRGNVRQGYRTLLLSESQLRIPRIVSQLLEEDISAYPYEDEKEPPRPGSIAVAHGRLNQGFAYTEGKLCILPLREAEAGSRRTGRKRRKKYQGSPLDSFSDLKVGDYVVHENHGVGIYHGIVQIEDEKSKRDYFKIVYKDGGTLYVPTTSLDLLQKYVAGEEAVPKLNRLGGNEWQRTKGKVRESVAKLAEDLVALYAARKARTGFAYSPDTVWQREFEEMFPYDETQDQLTAIEETKMDMESPCIMDRLICGDVGYGKTEVAIRAAFKAVQDGKQVAVLAPTTILAQPHYKTFSNRMRDYPIRIELLSRFRTPKQIKTAIDDTRKGAVDILIGTHRILSQDVSFKDLGLLVVDEEQRFGVSHKEKMKAMKEDVDVLTLTATPIPRTLHMCLTGIRDMSLLEEAPQDRQPIQTYVMEDDDQMVREAIYRELARNGQVFYLHNRVQTIDQAALRVQNLVPEARVAVAHGQMSERELEKVMLRFVEGEIDVLVCTTIIETGLDISNVNTIIIQNADAMGLAQLYQLRGRVGRSSRMAYAYFLYRKGKVLQEVAQKRLEAIGEFTEFGSGFKIAMRDLEIRGAGNVLGPEQHGHMGAVGYELYCKLLEEAMSKLQNQPVREDFETTVYIKVNAFIPPDYIPNEGQKLQIYKKIAAIRTEEDYFDMQDELTDRYSDMPQCVSNLLDITYIKALANQAGIETVEYKEGTGLQLDFRAQASLNAERLAAYLKENQGRVRVISGSRGTRMLIRLRHSDKDPVLLQSITQILKEINTLREEEEQA